MPRPTRARPGGRVRVGSFDPGTGGTCVVDLTASARVLADRRGESTLHHHDQRAEGANP